MKKESQPYNQLPDGSRDYGNGVWGPSTADFQRANLSFTNGKPKLKEEPSNHLLFISQESVVGELLQTMSKVRLPAKFAIPIGLAVAVLATACGSKNSEKSKLPSTPSPSESSAPPNPENLPPFAVLGIPFPQDPKMAIQQGWFYTGITGKKEHKGIDYIKGELDNSRTWQSFSVLAAADGFACANPPSREGNAVLLTHKIGNTPIGATYYGHLDAIEKDIPACDDKGKTPKLEKRGAKLGDAGATGVKDDRGIEQPTWKHLHFQVNDANGNSIDPYDIQKERDVYPDPNFKNGKPCGPKALLIDCYPKGAVVASPKDPIPPISAQVNEKKVEVASATSTSTPKKETPTQIQKEQPKSIEQQMQEAAFRTWLRLWSIHNQYKGGYGNVIYNIDIANTNIEDIVSKNGDIGKPLDINWAGGMLAFGPSANQGQAYKSSGEAQVDKIRAQTRGFIPASDADKANGLQWVGGTTITYIIRSRGNSYEPRGGWGSRETLTKWLVSKDSATDFPDFSEWRQEAFDIRIQVKNGKAEIIGQTDLYTNPGTGLEFFKLPSATLAKSRIIEYDPAIKFP